MSNRTTIQTQDHSITPAAMRRVAFATIIGNAVENYDFFLYGSAAALVFGPLFFEAAGPQAAILLSFASVGVSFLFRPVGALIAGHLGDKIGRKRVLVMTLLMMGGSSTIIGLLPTSQQIGLAAPILLTILRIIMGISLGGEWGGSALMAVEHAPVKRRGWFGSVPQMGIPLGMLLATGVFALMTGFIAPGSAFMTWGWRVPFLLSFILVIVGYFIRRGIEESPVFTALRGAAESSTIILPRVPIARVVRRHWRLLIVLALTLAGNTAAGYMTTGGFIQHYATAPASEGGTLGMAATPVLLAVTAAAAVWMVTTGFAGWLSDRIGRRNTYIIGWIVNLITVLFILFPLVNTGNVWLLFLALAIFSIGLGLTYGPASTNFVEMFPASIRYSGVSVTYAVGAILGGAFSPLISQALVQATGSSAAVSYYIAGMTLIGLICTLILKDRSRIPLGPEAEDLQATSPLYGSSAQTA